MSAVEEKPIPIRARFPSRCRDCDGPVSIGDAVLWTPGFGVVHADRDGCHAAQDHMQQLDMDLFPAADWGDQ